MDTSGVAKEGQGVQGTCQGHHPRHRRRSLGSGIIVRVPIGLEHKNCSFYWMVGKNLGGRCVESNIASPTSFLAGLTLGPASEVHHLQAFVINVVTLQDVE